MTTTLRLAPSRSSFAALLLFALSTLGATNVSAQAPAAGTSDSLSGWARALQGGWGCAGAFASGKPLAADITFTPVLRTHWVEYHHRDRAPGQYEATALLGPALRDSALVPVVLYDDFGGHRRFRASAAPSGEITLARDSTEAGARVERFTFRPRPDGTLWFGWEVQRDGTWVLGDSLSCRRGS